MQLTIGTGFPEPYLQPNRNEDCGFYTAAYVARCLGHPDVTAQQVKDWRAETRKHEAHYVHDVLGAQMRTHWTEFGHVADEAGRKVFWLGPGTEEWVRSWLADGWLAALNVHRIPEMGHAVALLDAADEGVLLHDPIYGHVIEPWGWFLGPGPKHDGSWPGSAPDGRAFYGCTYVEGWYRC